MSLRIASNLVRSENMQSGSYMKECYASHGLPVQCWL